MANELKHKAVGTVLSQAEFEATDSHVFNSQATGDIVIAGSSTQLERLGIGSTNNILNVSGGEPAWTATPTLTSVTVGTGVITDDVITFTPTTNDTVTMTAAANGAFSLVTVDTAAAAANIQITADGTVDIDSAGILTLDSGAAINIEPASGSAILLDGTISIDAGVLTGATAITSETIDATTDFTIGTTVITDDVITFTPTTSDTVVLTATTNGAFSLVTTDAGGAAANIQITADGTAELAGTTVTLDASGDIDLAAAADVNIPADVGLTFGDDAEKIEGDGTDLTISGNNINLTATKVVTASAGATVSKISAFSTTDAHQANLRFLKSANATIGTLSATADDEGLGYISWHSVNDSSAEAQSAYIICYQDGASSARPATRLDFAISDGTDMNVAMAIDSAGQIGIGGPIALGVGSDPSTLANYAHIYAKDDSGSAEVFVRDEAGNVTKISPHNEQGEWEFYTHNTTTGKTFRVNLERMIRKLEEFTGERFIQDEK